MISVGNGDIAVYAAFILISIMTFLNVLTLFSIIYLTDVKLHLTTEMFIGVFICIILTFYFKIIKDNKFENIIAKYQSESNSQIFKGKFIVLAYIIISPLLIFLLFYLMMLKNRGLL